MKWTADRVLGAISVLLAIVIVLVSNRYRVAFITDPVGPRGLPILVAVVFALGGALLMIRPGDAQRWPSRGMLRKGAAVIGVFLLYAFLLPRLGFFLATSMTVGVLAALFGGPVRKSLIAAAAYAALLWLLFAVALGLPLPIGSWLGGGA